MKHIAHATAVLLALTWCAFANAQQTQQAQTQTWDYTGSALTLGTANSSTNFPGQTALPPEFSSITGYVVISGTLGDNLNNVLVTPSVFNMSEGPGDVIVDNGVNVGASQGYESLYVSTNSTGQITAWSMTFGEDNGSASNPFGFVATSTTNGDSTTGYMGSDGCCSTGWTASSNTAGIWVDPPSAASPSAAPEIDPGSAIGGLTLLLGGLAVVRGRRCSLRS